MKTLLLTLLLVPMMSFGQNNYSMSFDGVDDFVNITNPSSSQVYTFACWFKESYNGGYIVSRGHNTHWIEMHNAGNLTSGTSSNSFGTTYYYNTMITMNTWYHVAIIYDGNAFKQYINGVETFSIAGNAVTPVSDMLLGKDPNHTADYTGFIDDVCLWDIPLTETEIQQYMDCPPIGTESGLVGYWNFEEGSGTTALDLTSNGNNGTINGATYSTDVPFQNCCVATSSTDVITACDSYTWLDGNTYTASTNNPNPTLHTINAGSYYYLPSTLTINTGDVVEWINDGGFHDVNGETNTITGQPYNNPEVFNSPSTSVVGAVIYSHTFTLPGTYEYDCSVGQHAANGMTGILTVLSPPTYTIPNIAGCDSVITLDLTINYSNTGTDVITACDSYTWVDGNTYTSSNNTATWTETNAAGCDSLVTLDLTINNSSSSTDIVTACDSYSWVDGNTYTASNNSATWIETNAAGCDSVVTLDLTINNSSSSTDIITACDSYTWLDGNNYTASNNTATYTTTNAAGCDSVVTLDLTINYSNTGGDVITACDSYTWLDGNTYTASNNIATYTIPNATGCDSIVTLDLTINSSNTGTDVITACDSYTWADGNTYTISNNTATYTATNADGCDSVVTLNLTIVPLPNNSVTQTGATLTADQGGASYEWLDCGSNLVPVGGSWQSFLPAFSGNYAVEVTLNGCIDTSDCFLIDYTSHLNNITNSTIIKIYPNPTSDILMISGLNKVSGVRGLEITSPKGDIVRRLEGTKEEINVSMLKSGIYFLNINHDKGVETIRFIKQ